MIKNKITFKKEKRETGLSAVANPYPDTIIKLNKKEIGCIVAPSAFGYDFYKVKLMVFKNNINEDKNPNCVWRWITFKANFDSEIEAKNAVKHFFNNEELYSKYNYYSHKD